MSFEDPKDKAREFGLAAIDLMGRCGVALTPMNYRVWYTFVAGRDPDLVKSLNVLLSNGVEFTPDRNREIYEQFFDAGDVIEGLHTTSAKLESFVSEILRQLDRTRVEQRAYCDKMTLASGDIATTSDADRLAGLVKNVLAETRDIVRKSQTLEERLSESSGEIATLRRSLERVREEALTDGLTGIANRRFLDVRLRDEMMAAMESGEPFCLALADIDHFKKFNDAFGHRIGDEVLKLAARVLKDNVKGQDTPARYGGEEFCILLPRTRLADAVKLGNKIRRTLAGRALTNKKTGRSYGQITMSLGIALYRPGESIDEFLTRADEALYRAKRDGRNRVECEAPSDGSLTLAS